jgi:protein-S-isoprenylcysteine O-methyltransferase Ste14
VDFQNVLKFLTLAYLIGVGFWFATAQAKFSKSSKAQPMLFVMVGCSLVATLATLVATVSDAVPLSRIMFTIATTTLCVFLIKWAFRSINKGNLGLVFSGVVPSEVIQHGPYRYVRHPLYLAYSMFWLGCVAFSASIFVGIAACAIIILYVLAARAEERDLMSSSLGGGYASYRERTGLIIPRVFSKRTRH